MSLESEELVPIYKDQRRVVKEEKENIRDYTGHQISKMESQVYDEKMKNYYSKSELEDSAVYLGEDWYLIYENKENGNIYISDLARVEPNLEEERGIQQKEILSALSTLINSSNEIEADLKEDTSYMLYLMNKRLGYIEQIGEDISYPYDEEEMKKAVTLEEQEEILKQMKKIREDKNPNFIMHKVKFKKK